MYGIVIKNMQYSDRKGVFAMYSDTFCKVYNEFGWNYAPEAFGGKLLEWMARNDVTVGNSLDLACGTGILCEILQKNGIQAAGMDFSEGMIAIAKAHNPEIHYEVADMITYRPDIKFDLVTCTGDALNHIMDLKDVNRIFENVYGYLSEGGYFIFDMLKDDTAAVGDPIDLEFSEEVKAQFMVTRDAQGVLNLKTTVFENGNLQVEENIREKVHDPETVCSMLQKLGFRILKCADQLLDDAENHSTTWYVIAGK